MRQGVALNSIFLGFLVGLVFGMWDLAFTWLRPLEDDSPGALLLFYGPMFLVWTVISFRAARRHGPGLHGLIAGMAVAFGTFCVFVFLNFLQVNLFLDQLVGRPDWQNMMMRFRASGSENLRLFINLDYVRGTSFKIAVATAFGAVFGGIGGMLAWLTRARTGMRTA